MKSYIFKTDDGRFPITKYTPRVIKFRGKPICNENVWVEGSYMFNDNNTNNPLNNTIIKEKHRIISYYSGDWNMGGWNENEIHTNTLQQYTGVNDENNICIYEGDIVRIYFSVSYDEDGECTVGNEYKEDIVTYKDGSFYFPNIDIHLHEINNLYKLYVIGNVFDTREHELSKDYHINTLYNNFIRNKVDTYPELIELKFLEFIKNVYTIPMYNFVCYYSELDKDLNIKFIFNGKKYVIWETLDETIDEDGYKLPKYSATLLKDIGIEKIFESDNINEIINNIKETMN